MQEFDHIQSLWQSHSVEVKISSDEMLSQAKKEVTSIRTRSLFNISGMALSIAAIVALCSILPFQFLDNPGRLNHHYNFGGYFYADTV